MSLTTKLFKACERNNISVYRLSQLTGINRSVLGRYKLGTRDMPVSTFEKICEVLSITITI